MFVFRDMDWVFYIRRWFQSTSQNQREDEDADDESDENEGEKADLGTLTDINLVIEGKKAVMNEHYEKQRQSSPQKVEEEEEEHGLEEEAPEDDDDEVFLPAQPMKTLKGHRKAVPTQIMREYILCTTRLHE